MCAGSPHPGLGGLERDSSTRSDQLGAEANPPRTPGTCAGRSAPSSRRYGSSLHIRLGEAPTTSPEQMAPTRMRNTSGGGEHDCHRIAPPAMLYVKFNSGLVLNHSISCWRDDNTRALSPEQRRKQLLEIGARLFAERHRPGLDRRGPSAPKSPGAAVPYFPHQTRLLRPSSGRIQPTSSTPVLTHPCGGRTAQRRTRLCSCTTWKQHEHSYRAVAPRRRSADPDIRAIVETATAELDGASWPQPRAQHHDTELLHRRRFRGWPGLHHTTCWTGSTRRTITREQLGQLCARTCSAPSTPNTDLSTKARSQPASRRRAQHGGPHRTVLLDA